MEEYRKTITINSSKEYNSSPFHTTRKKMYCAISGKVPKEPVLSLESRCVYERRLVEEYVRQHGTDPVNGRPLAVEQLVEINVDPESMTLVNAANSATLNSNYSIPSLLSTLQNEWDAVMLENFELRKAVESLKKKLSTTLYERDAAKKVALKAISQKRKLQSEVDRLATEVTLVETTGNDDAPSKKRKMDTEPSHAELAVPDSNFSDELLASSVAYLKETKPLLKQSNISKDSEIVFDKLDKIAINNKSMTFTSLLAENKSKSLALIHDKSISHIKDPKNTTMIDMSEQLATGDDLELVVPTTGEDILVKTTNNRIMVLNTKTKQAQQIELGGSELGNLLYLYSHENVKPEYCVWADDKGNIGYVSKDGKTDVRVRQTENSDDMHYDKVDLHKDGILIALARSSCVEILNLCQPDDPPIKFEIGSELPNDAKAITNVKFCPNGFYFIVELDGDVLYTFDLRKSPPTLSSNPLPISGGCWDFDITGRFLLLNKSLDSNRIEFQFHQYDKTANSWKAVQTREVVLGDNSSFNSAKSMWLLSHEDTSFILLYSDDNLLTFDLK